MGELIRFNETQLRQELTRQLSSVQLATALTTISLREITSLRQTSASEVAETLQKAQQLIDEATRTGIMTAAKEGALWYMTKAYLEQILTITDTGSTQVVNLLLTCSIRR
jgi:hypothetical protein